MTPLTATAAHFDRTFWAITGVSVALLVGITAFMIFCLVRYDRRRHPVAAQIEGNLLAETIWTVIPTLLVLWMFFEGWSGFRYLREVPPGAMTVRVDARMWVWSYAYENGARSDTLFVPVGRPIRLVLTSRDVVHSFFVPAFRVKEDAVPGRENYLWFEAAAPGTYDVFCAEYCGEHHSRMLSKIVAMPPAEFEAYLAGAAPPDTGP